MSLKYPTAEEIIKINILTAHENGGNIDLAGLLENENSFFYMIESINAEYYGTPLNPTIFDKAAFYFEKITMEHIFYDGNKRTGFLTALYFLNINGYEQSERVTQSEIYDFTIEVAINKVSKSEISNWLKSIFFYNK